MTSILLTAALLLSPLSAITYSAPTADLLAANHVLPAGCNVCSGTGARTYTATISFGQTFALTPAIMLALNQAKSNAISTMNFQLSWSSVTTTNFVLTVTASNSLAFTNLRVRYLSSSYSPLKLSSRTITSFSFINVNTPSNRTERFNFPLTLDSSMNIKASIYLLGVSMTTSTTNLGVLTSFSIASASLTISVSAIDNTVVTSISVGTVIYQKTTAQLPGYMIFQGSLQATNTQSTFRIGVTNTMVSCTSSFLMGLGGYFFDVTKGINLNFYTLTSDINLIFSYSYSPSQTGLNFAFGYFLRIAVSCTPQKLQLDRRTCAAVCSVGFSDANDVCQPCHYSCSTCSSAASTACTACAGVNRALAGASPNSCPCNNDFFDGSVSSCLPCSFNCFTCSTQLSTACLSCDATDKRAVTPNCNCLSGFYQNNVALCATCHYSCSTCTSYPLCTGCAAASNRIGSPVNGYCGCTAGNYDNGVQVCVGCLAACSTCNGPSNNNCTSCSSALNRVLMGTSCVCKNKFYEDAGNLCQACHAKCLNCTGPTFNQCVACDQALKRLLSGTTCPCMTGFYDTATVCASCHYSCYTCSSNTASTCVDCDLSKQRWKLGSTCPCLSHYFDPNSAQCQVCHFSCWNCTGNAANDCVNCKADTFRTLTGSSCLCNDGYYQGGVTICRLCNLRCKTCSGANSNNCLSCFTDRQFHLVSSQCPCLDGYFFSLNQCVPCHYTCLTCTTGLSNGCSTCDGILDFRSLSTGSCNCLTGYYDPKLPACAPCFSRCLACNNLFWNCTSCKAAQNRQLQGNSCVCKPKFFQPGADTCQPCGGNCLTCTVFATLCTSCNVLQFRFLNEPTATCDCNPGYFDNSVPICVICHASCLTCSGPNSNQCLSCVTTRQLTASSTCICLSSAYIISATVCGNCHQTCKTCNGPSSTNCQSCFDHQFRFLSTNQCICIATKFDSTGTCSPCHYSCYNCTAFNLCSNCPTNSFRLFSAAAQACPCNNGYFDAGIAACSPCHYSCSTCINLSTFCLTCAATRSLLSNTCPCVPGKYDNGFNLCLPCSYKCLTCAPNAISCTSCDSAVFRVQSGPSCLCISGYYDSNPCQPCLWPCVTCAGPTRFSCYSCAATLTLQAMICSCKIGTYISGLSCISCFSGCLSCRGGLSSECLSCQYPLILIANTCRSVTACPAGLYNYQSFCISTCPMGTYLQALVCQDCPSLCSACRSFQMCTACSTGFLQKGACVSKCSKSYYISGSDCLPCSNNCIACTLASVLVCMQCSKGLLYFLGDCVSACPKGAYSVLSSCFVCAPQCSACSGPRSDQCSQCMSAFALQGSTCKTCQIGTTAIKGLCQQCAVNCLNCVGSICLQCNSSTSYFQQGQCPPFGMFNQNGVFQNCYPTCTTCLDNTVTDCLSCRPNSGKQGLPINGRCDCQDQSLATYQQGCDKNASLFKLVRDLSVSSTAAAGIVAFLSPFIHNQWQSASLFLHQQQTIGALGQLKGKLAYGYQTAINHYSLYGLDLIPWRGDNRTFGGRLLTENRQTDILLKYLIIQAIIWSFLGLLFLLLKCSYWEGSFLNSDQQQTWLTRLLYLFYAQLPFRTLQFSSFQVVSSVTQVFVKKSNSLALAICATLAYSVQLFYFLYLILANSVHYSNPKAETKFVFRGMVASKITVKSGLTEVVYLAKQISFAIAVGCLSSINLLVFIYMAISLLCLLYFIKFNPYSQLDRIAMCAAEFSGLLHSLVILLISVSADNNLKNILSMSGMLIGVATSILLIGILLTKTLRLGQEDRPSVERISTEHSALSLK